MTCQAAFCLIRWWRLRSLNFLLVLGFAASAGAQTPVEIRVDASQSQGRFNPVYRYFGYDEPNYTYAENGRKLVGELAALSEGPVYIRAHHLLTTGDGARPLNGAPPTLIRKMPPGSRSTTGPSSDRILDTYVQARAKPSSKSASCRRRFRRILSLTNRMDSPGAVNDKYYVGWSYPPTDYQSGASWCINWCCTR